MKRGVGYLPHAFRVMLEKRVARFGIITLAMLAMIAVFADVLASDLPLACSVHGKVSFAPAITRSLTVADAAEASWAIRPMVAFGPSTIDTHVAAPSRPSLADGHPFGTDQHGRDVFARVAHGTRTTLTFALSSVIAFIVLGSALGAISGFFGGPIDALFSRLVETMTAFPTLVLVLGVQASLDKPSVLTLFFAVCLTRWTEVARLVRAEVMLVGTRDYVVAAKALGASPLRILARHVIPNAWAPIVVSAAFGLGSVILVEASVDFLHASGERSSPSWGETLSEVRNHPDAWWLFLFPAIILFVLVVAQNLVGESLRDALDPRLSRGTRPLPKFAPRELAPPSSLAINSAPRA